MKLKILTTGSKGNCYILDTGSEQIILDAGATKQAIIKAFDFKMKGVAGALITHEHGDHAKGAAALSAAGIPIFCSFGTYRAIFKVDDCKKYPVYPITAARIFDVGSWIVKAFRTEHDAAEPFGFLMANTKTAEKILYLTDSFYCKSTFTGVTSVIIECNYCEEVMEENIKAGKFSESQASRIKTAHMSLGRLKAFLSACDLSRCRNIILVHLSDRNSNEAQMVREITALTGIKTIAAHDGAEINLDECPF